MGVILTLFISVIFYVQASQSGWGAGIDAASRTYFSKPLFTGREEIWSDLLRLIMQEPWFGHCSNCATQASQENDAIRNLSSHNTFIEITYRVGLFGLILFVSMLYSIWMRLYRYRVHYHVRIAGVFIISSFVFMSSGEYWFSNIIMINSLGWLIIGLGYGSASMFIRSRIYSVSQ